jgi:uncharacterized protein YaiI (UPF0178 family)
VPQRSGHCDSFAEILILGDDTADVDIPKKCDKDSFLVPTKAIVTRLSTRQVVKKGIKAMSKQGRYFIERFECRHLAQEASRKSHLFLLASATTSQHSCSMPSVL